MSSNEIPNISIADRILIFNYFLLNIQKFTTPPASRLTFSQTNGCNYTGFQSGCVMFDIYPNKGTPSRLCPAAPACKMIDRRVSDWLKQHIPFRPIYFYFGFHIHKKQV